MKINFYRIIDIVFLLGILRPMNFEWCAYSERGFTGMVMFTNPIFIACVTALLFFRKNIKYVFIEYFLLILSYFYSPVMLLRSLSFLDGGFMTLFSLLQPAFLMSFFFAVLWGMWIIISIFISQKSYYIE